MLFRFYRLKLSNFFPNRHAMKDRNARRNDPVPRLGKDPRSFLAGHSAVPVVVVVGWGMPPALWRLSGAFPSRSMPTPGLRRSVAAGAILAGMRRASSSRIRSLWKWRRKSKATRSASALESQNQNGTRKRIEKAITLCHADSAGIAER